MSIEPSSDAIRWKQLTKLFDDLSDGDAATRQQELNALRLRDPVLATELENMLRADASLGGVLDQDLHQFAGTLISEAAMSATDSNSLEQTHVNQKIGDFELQKRIGEGGMGEVWLAKRDTDGFVQQVALKLLKRGMDSDELSRRFARERKILAQLDHPHIARFVDGGASADGRLYYAMELVDGQSLTAFCKSQSLDLRQRLAVFLKVVAAVAHAQNQSVVHRDLKPSNILIDTQGNPRLLDFGIAKMLTESSLDVETQTAAELRALSPAYAAPEQILGEPISNATDVFALGVILFELLTDERPHQRSGNLSALALQVSNENADSMGATIKRRAQSEKISKLERAQTQGWRRHIDADLEVIVSTAMQRDPKRRYQSAAELAEDLQRWVNHQPIRAQADSMTYRARKFVARHRYAVGSASAVLLALIAGFGAALWQANVARQQAKRAEVELQRTQTIKDFTLSLFREQDPFARSTAAARTPSELIRLGLERAQSQFENDPTLRLALLDDLAEIQMALGDHAPALEQLKKNIVERQADANTSAVTFARTKVRMATALGGLGQYAEAESMARESATALCALLGVNSPECIRADGVRLRLWIPTGSQAELDVLSNDVLTRANRVFGPDTTETLTYIIDRSTVLERFDQYEAMREVMLDFINRVERTRGKDHAFLVRPLARLGDLERILTHQDKAMEYFDRAIALARQHEQTSMIAALLMRRGDSFRRMERNAEAKVDFDESARLMKPDSAELAQLQQMRGVLASAELDFEAAIAHLKSSQIVFEKALGKATVYSWTSVIARIGIELKRANAKHQALPAGLLQEAIDADAAMHALSPPPSFDVFLSRGTLAQVHAALKQDQEALKRFEEAIQVGVKVYSADHPSVLEAQVQQAEIMRAHDRVKAEQILRQVLATPTLTEKLKAQAQAVLDLN